MIFAITSYTYSEAIIRTIKECELLLIGSEQSEELYLLKFIKEKSNSFSNLDSIVIDLCALKDQDEEILSALESFKILHGNVRIIILASNRCEGDSLLTKLFQMGVYDLINSDDFLEINKELTTCLTVGMQFKDSIRFKELKANQEKVIIKNEIKQVVSKVMITLAGSAHRVGVTHNTVILANYLRKRGYMVAVVELNNHHDFIKTQESMEEKMFDDLYFSIYGVDYYPNVNTDLLSSILGKTYNFILVDCGVFQECDRVTFNKGEQRFIITSSRPWETDYLNSVFNIVDAEDVLKSYHYFFNFTNKKYETDIIDSMKPLSNVHFFSYQDDPFESNQFTDADEILKNYLPTRTDTEKKKSLFRKKA